MIHAGIVNFLSISVTGYFFLDYFSSNFLHFNVVFYLNIHTDLVES